MAKISGTFENFWQDLERKAKDQGVGDGDLSQVRRAVKNVLIAAGWADAAGNVEFLSEADKTACKAAADAEVARVVPAMAQARTLNFTAGFHPTKNALQASTATEMTAVSPVSAAFNPVLAKVGDKCPRCEGSMQAVGLVNERAALYCPKDRVVMPLPSGVSLR